MKKDYTNQKFNYLTAISPVGKMRDRGSIYWKFRCDCGTEKTLDPYSVTSGHVKSCGCMQDSLVDKAKRLPPGEAMFRMLYRGYKTGAEARGYSFELSVDDFKTLTKQFCYYCGTPPSQLYKIKHNDTYPYRYNGVDRLDNTQGYNLNNCVPCCGKCNKLKSNLDYKEFAKLVRDIYENRFGMIEESEFA